MPPPIEQSIHQLRTASPRRHNDSINRLTAFLTFALGLFSIVDRCFGASSAQLEDSFSPPVALTNEFGRFRSPAILDDGRRVLTPQDWTIRRQEIVRYWHSVMGTWPPLLTKPSVQILFTQVTNSIRLHRVRLEIAADRFEEGWLLVPTNNYRRPAVLVPFYDPETSTGRKGANRDFAWQLARRGFVTLSIGSPGGD